MKVTDIVTVVHASELVASFVDNVKGLNSSVTTVERVAARRAISVATATLYRLKVLSTPTPVQRFVLKFRAKDSKNLAVYEKSVVLAGLIAFTTFFELENTKVFKVVEVAKIVLFEELVELGLDFLAIEDMIQGASKDLEDSLES